jgi:hypothetical protein
MLNTDGTFADTLAIPTKAPHSVEDIPPKRLAMVLGKARAQIAQQLGRDPSEVSLSLGTPIDLESGELALVVRRRAGKWSVHESVTVERFNGRKGELWLDPIEQYEDGFVTTRDGPYARLEYLMENVTARVMIQITDVKEVTAPNGQDTRQGPYTDRTAPIDALGASKQSARSLSCITDTKSRVGRFE